MKVETTEQPQREAVLDIQLDPEEVEPFLERAYRKIVQRANIQGFRKGKAPRRIVEQIYGREYLLQEAVEFMLPEVTSKAIQEGSLEIAGIPSVNLTQLDPLSITATVPLTPTVDLGDYKSIRIKKDPVKIDKMQIDKVLEQLQMDIAPWEPVEDATGYEDLLNVTVRGWTEDKEFLNQERADFVPRIESRIPTPGFAEALIGIRAHETKEFVIDVPEDFEHQEVAGKACNFEVTVHIVKRKKPGKLDDEFAKSIGEGYESLTDMRTKIKGELTQSQEMVLNNQHQQDTLNKVLEGARIELSPLLIDHEADHVIGDYQESLNTGRMTAEQYQQYISWAGKSPEEIREESRTEAATRIKQNLILQEIVSTQNLAVTDEDMEKEITAIVERAGPQGEVIRENFQGQDRLDSLRRFLLNRKSIEFISDLAAGSIQLKTKTKSTVATNDPTKKTKRAPARKNTDAKRGAKKGGKLHD